MKIIIPVSDYLESTETLQWFQVKQKEKTDFLETRAEEKFALETNPMELLANN